MSILNGINLMENSKIPGRSFAELIGFFEVCARLLEALHLKAARGNWFCGWNGMTFPISVLRLPFGMGECSNPGAVWSILRL
mmetsp:Transcript_13053/g.34633  ORF Transcript_13053/g.34633 Transcript_13053/m.34633 type:complete len:82 (+) Transcript_13053:669-914(+)